MVILMMALATRRVVVATEGGPMGIGGSIFLLAVGAILAFAVDAQVSGIDINVVGWVLMIAGLVGLAITIWYMNSRRRTVVTEQRVVPGVAPGQAPVVDEYHQV